MKNLIRISLMVALLCAGNPVFAQTNGEDSNQPATQTQPSDETTQGESANNDESANADQKTQTEPQISIYDNALLKPRDVYNLALTKLQASEYDVAIEGFLKARDFAAFDNELRYNAAYNLAHAYADKAAAAGDPNQIGDEELQGVIANLEMSVAWFRDAVKQRASKEATGNLEIVLKRMLDAKDIMAQKFNTIEKQLDATIAQEATLRESARVLSERILKNNAQRDPIGFQDDFRQLAKLQREALTQANLVSENLSNAIAKIESKSEDQRSQEEAFREFQLKSAEPLLENARQGMAHARRQMRELSIENTLRLTTRTYYQLKQAREQLENPLAILGHLTEDQQTFVRYAAARQTFDSPENIEKIREKTQQPDFEAPPWLNLDLLKDTQIDNLERTNRLVAVLNAFVQAADQQPEPQNQDPKQAEAAKEQMEQIREALPLIEDAASSMQLTTQNLEESDTSGAVTNGGDALQKLIAATEIFADLKHLIELAYSSELMISATVHGDLSEVAGRHDDEDKSDYLLSRQAQTNTLKDSLPVNIRRVDRLSSLIAKEHAKITQESAQAAQSGKPALSDEQQQQVQQQFEMAENLRKAAFQALENMHKIVAASSSPDDSDDSEEHTQSGGPVGKSWTQLEGDALTAEQSLEQLRMLFFTIIEHIQELYRQQSKTLDSTTDVASLSEDERSMKLPPIVDRQRMHELTAEKLAEILNQQASQLQQAAQQQQQQGQQQQGQDPAEMARRFSQAASELQVASTSMRQVQTDLGAEEPLFTESIQEQNTALEHIKTALELLQPPQQQQNQQNQQNQQQQQQDQQQQQQQQQQKMSKEQADKKIQQIRSRDQQRRKSKKDKENGAGMPVVEKDW